MIVETTAAKVGQTPVAVSISLFGAEAEELRLILGNSERVFAIMLDDKLDEAGVRLQSAQSEPQFAPGQRVRSLDTDHFGIVKRPTPDKADHYAVTWDGRAYPTDVWAGELVPA
jgi:hypothetical protein